MARASGNGIEIEYETFGDPRSRPVLLIMGLGAQMIFWHDELCAALAESGHYVVRFDNRDVGLSTHLDAAGVPNVMELVLRARAGQPVEAPYTLDDMADDAVALLDALGLERAHVCGASMGGMIAQTLGFRHPQRVQSVISIMSSTGDTALPPSTPQATAVLLTPPPSQRDAYVEFHIRAWGVIGSPGFPEDEGRIRELAGRAFDRCFDPGGVARQLAAILAHGSRRERLRGIRAPMLVLHGSADPLVPLECGRDTAACVPGSELHIIEGMGHDLPRGAWPELVTKISAHTAKAEGV